MCTEVCMLDVNIDNVCRLIELAQAADVWNEAVVQHVKTGFPAEPLPACVRIQSISNRSSKTPP